MNRSFLQVGLLACAACAMVQAQTHPAPYAPFTAREAELGKALAAKSLDIRKQITDGSAPAEPFKIMGNLYFVGDANGEVFLLSTEERRAWKGTPTPGGGVVRVSRNTPHA
jgi:hypothetical protein